MADISVRRKGPTVWPWIVGLLVAALIIWAALEGFGRPEAEVVEDDPSAAVTRTPRP